MLPPEIGYEWSGLSWEEVRAGHQALLIFVLGLTFVFLVLSAQYESFALPIIIILAVPLALLGALAAQRLRGPQNDVFCQIGLLMLIGLASKNAILIVEFAEQLRAGGARCVDAVTEATMLRLRPILMTSLAFLIGILPLVFAGGVGRERAPLAGDDAVRRPAAVDGAEPVLHAGAVHHDGGRPRPGLVMRTPARPPGARGLFGTSRPCAGRIGAARPAHRGTC